MLVFLKLRNFEAAFFRVLAQNRFRFQLLARYRGRRRSSRRQQGQRQRVAPTDSGKSSESQLATNDREFRRMDGSPWEPSGQGPNAARSDQSLPERRHGATDQRQ